MSALITRDSASKNIMTSYLRPRVKICGITRECDVEAVCNSGADAIGFVFYEKSPRQVNLKLAKILSDKVLPFVNQVGLFVDATEKQISDALDKVNLDVLQFHGNETEHDCLKYGKPYIKAIRMAPGLNVLEEVSKFPSARGFLLDSYKKGVPGGTGLAFDWESIPSTLRGVLTQPVILAGGLKPSNVAEAIKLIKPYAVDLSGGVEREPGIKDATLIHALMKEINEVSNAS